MIGWTLQSAGYRPTVVNGGIMRNFETETDLGNAACGAGDVACIEADESDGTCVNYRPSIGVITGFARDHKELGGAAAALLDVRGEHAAGAGAERAGGGEPVRTARAAARDLRAARRATSARGTSASARAT